MIFISYAREDVAEAQRLSLDLTSAGFETWLDVERLLPGQKWADEIEKAIKNSSYFIALLSTRSVSKRGFVQKELKKAVDVLHELPYGMTYVIPARLDNSMPTNPELQEYQWVDMLPNWEKGIELIISSLKSDAGKIDLKKRYEELIEFNQLFFHELRTPISNFILTPTYIGKQIDKLDIEPNKKSKILKMLNDIKVVGYRLKHIVSTHNIDELIDTSSIDKLSLLADIVLPVYNINIQGRAKAERININHESLNAVFILADKTLLNIAFNALLDNAIKYSRGTNKPIEVYGKIDKSGRYFHLYIENYGICIDPAEATKIFENRYRGENARLTALAGTGMGLYITKKIMDKIGGDVTLLKTENPVIIGIKLPLAF